MSQSKEHRSKKLLYPKTQTLQVIRILVQTLHTSTAATLLSHPKFFTLFSFTFPFSLCLFFSYVSSSCKSKEEKEEGGGWLKVGNRLLLPVYYLRQLSHLAASVSQLQKNALQSQLCKMSLQHFRYTHNKAKKKQSISIISLNMFFFSLAKKQLRKKWQSFHDLLAETSIHCILNISHVTIHSQNNINSSLPKGSFCFFKKMFTESERKTNGVLDFKKRESFIYNIRYVTQNHQNFTIY